MISVIIPFHNCSQYIGNCLLSIIHQTYKDYELILIDDASTDNGSEIVLDVLKKYPEIKFSLISLEENNGCSFARNKGIQHAKGEYIYFIDADDELSSTNSLETFAKHIGEGFDFITAEMQYKYDGGVLKKSDLNEMLSQNTIFKNDDVFEAFVERKISVVAWNKLYRKTFLQDNEILFQEDILHEDEIWTFQVCYYAKNVLAINDKTYHYFQSNNHSIMNRFSQKNIDSIQFILEYIVDFCEKHKVFHHHNQNKIANYIHALCHSTLNRNYILNNRNRWLKTYGAFQNVFHNNKFLKENSPYFSRNPNKAYFWEKYYKKYSKLFDLAYSIKRKLTSVISH